MPIERARASRTTTALLALASVAVVVVVVTPVRARAQVTLVADGTSALAVEPGVADGLRQGLGASVRRVDPSLEELALAAGCEDEPTEPACIARIAGVSGARFVAIEHVSRANGGYRVALDLRRGSDGGRVRSLSVHCDTNADCSDRLVSLFESESREAELDEGVAAPLATVPVRHVRPDESAAPSDVEPPRAEVVEAAHPDPRPRVGQARTTSFPLVPNVLFGAAIASSLGAMIAGGVGLGTVLSRDTLAAIVAAHPDQTSQLVALDQSRDLSLGVGTTFALVGACLAVVGAVLLATAPRPDASGPRLRLSGSFDATTATLTMRGSF